MDRHDVVHHDLGAFAAIQRARAQVFEPLTQIAAVGGETNRRDRKSQVAPGIAIGIRHRHRGDPAADTLGRDNEGIGGVLAQGCDSRVDVTVGRIKIQRLGGQRHARVVCDLQLEPIRCRGRGFKVHGQFVIGHILGRMQEGRIRQDVAAEPLLEQRVASAAALEHIDAQPARQTVIPGAADQGIVAILAHQRDRDV